MRPYRLDIDWAILSEQKRHLLELISDHQGAHHLDGLVHLIDEIQDQGERMGEKVVWLEEAL